MCEHTWLNKKSVSVTINLVPILERKEKEISFFILSIKPVKVKEEDIAVRNVEKRSLPPLEQPIIGYRNQKPLSIK